MNWSTPKDLKAQLARLWERGELLRDQFAEEARFPLRLSVKGPTSAEITDRFEAVRTWAATLATTPPLRVEWQEVRHRVHGLQRLRRGLSGGEQRPHRRQGSGFARTQYGVDPHGSLFRR